MPSARTPVPTEPTVLLCAHGTARESGQAMVIQWADEFRQLVPQARLAYVDVQEPTFGQALSELLQQGRAPLVVPLFLAAGFHVHVDIPDAIREAQGEFPHSQVEVLPHLHRAPGWVSEWARAWGATLPADLSDRDELWCVATGSSNAAANAEVAEFAAGLGTELGHPVQTAFLSTGSPLWADVIDSGPASKVSNEPQGKGRRFVLGYLLADGYFATKLARLCGSAGAHLCNEPLLASAAGRAQLTSAVMELLRTSLQFNA